MARCIINNCRNNSNNGRYCYKCSSRRWRENNPIRSAYNNLRTNAKRRGKEFSITFEDFREFATKTNYMYGKGRNRDSLHIDREREDEGYHKDNLQVLKNIDNVRKYLKWVTDERGVPTDFKFVKAPEPDNDLPF